MISFRKRMVLKPHGLLAKAYRCGNIDNNFIKDIPSFAHALCADLSARFTTPWQSMHRVIKVLLVDDEADVLDFITYNFQKEGYITLTARDGIEAINVARKEKPDLMILDILMPRLDGYAVMEHIRNSPDLHGLLIVMLTALNDEESELKGFAAGADDYVTKPIKPRLLISRVNALLRRKHELNQTGEIIRIGSLVIDKERRQVKLNEHELQFAKKEFDLLALLASKPGRVFQRQEILTNIWSEDTIAGDRTIDVHISTIRKKVGTHSVKTIKGVGYKFGQ
jgi:two-component system alkaline phosphatase synthesis response regulator PhoP